MQSVEAIYRERLANISETIEIRKDWMVPKDINNPLDDNLLS
jgi:hypothetical protein